MTSRILNENLLSLDIVSNATVSSEQAAFPATNIYNAQRRSKVWRSNGYWEVTTSNNTIQFKETTGGGTLTATVSAAEYSSNATFLAAVKSALDTAGASTYTVSIDTSTKKIKIVSDGGGGGGDFEILWTSSTMADLLGFSSASDDTGALTYIADAVRIGTSEWVKWDFGISTNPSAFVLIGKRNSPIAISPTATVKLQANETDAWSSPQYSQTLTLDDAVIYLFKSASADGLHTEALRYWRLLIEDLDNPNGYVEVGSLFLGDFFEPTRGAVQIPFSGEYIDRSETVFSAGGQSFSDKREQSEQFTLDWFGLTVSEKETIDTIFSDFGTATPLFIQLDPDSAMSSSANYYMRYVKFINPPSYELVAPGVYAVTMDFREEL